MDQKNKLTVFREMIKNKYAWTGSKRCGPEPYWVRQCKLEIKQPMRTYRICLSTYTSKRLEINFRLGYLCTYDSSAFSANNLYWLELIIEDKYQQLEKKLLLKMKVYKDAEEANEVLLAFQKIREQTTFVNVKNRRSRRGIGIEEIIELL